MKRSVWRQEEPMEISARNQLQGTVRSVELGTIMSEVVVGVGGQEIVAATPTAAPNTLVSRPAQK
jgi:molybdopterin-binding protein